MRAAKVTEDEGCKGDGRVQLGTVEEDEEDEGHKGDRRVQLGTVEEDEGCKR